MGYRIMATPILDGKVIDGCWYATTNASENVTDAMIGATVIQVIANCRRLGWHMAAPGMSIRVEFTHVG